VEEEERIEGYLHVSVSRVEVTFIVRMKAAGDVTGWWMFLELSKLQTTEVMSSSFTLLEKPCIYMFQLLLDLNGW